MFLNFQWDTWRKSASGLRYSESPRKMVQNSWILVQIRGLGGAFVAFNCFPALKARNLLWDKDFRNLHEKWCRLQGFSPKFVAWGVVSWRFDVFRPFFPQGSPRLGCGTPGNPPPPPPPRTTRLGPYGEVRRGNLRGTGGICGSPETRPHTPLPPPEEGVGGYKELVN